MINLLKFVFILFFLISPLKAEEIKNIIIEGNKRVSDETIKIYGEIDDKKKYSDQDSNLILQNLYHWVF